MHTLESSSHSSDDSTTSGESREEELPALIPPCAYCHARFTPQNRPFDMACRHTAHHSCFQAHLQSNSCPACDAQTVDPATIPWNSSGSE